MQNRVIYRTAVGFYFGIDIFFTGNLVLNGNIIWKTPGTISKNYQNREKLIRLIDRLINQVDVPIRTVENFRGSDIDGKRKGVVSLKGLFLGSIKDKDFKNVKDFGIGIVIQTSFINFRSNIKVYVSSIANQTSELSIFFNVKKIYSFNEKKIFPFIGIVLSFISGTISWDMFVPLNSITRMDSA